MANFKVGDRVKVKRNPDNTTGFGKNDFIAEITDAGSGNKPYAVRCYPYIGRNYEGWFDAEELELIQDYHPITPKVGKRYRVVKKYKNCMNADAGFITTVNRINILIYCKDSSGSDVPFCPEDFTTEYLELVEEIKPLTIPKNYFDGLVNAIKPATQYYTFGTNMMEEMQAYKWEAKPIKQSLITKSMNFIKKLTQSAADKTLEKARFTDECGNLTGLGTSAIMSLVFQEKKEALVKLAEEVIAEETK